MNEKPTITHDPCFPDKTGFVAVKTSDKDGPLHLIVTDSDFSSGQAWKIPFLVKCPKCGAEPGKKCIQTGKFLHHKARVDAGIKLLEVLAVEKDDADFEEEEQ